MEQKNPMIINTVTAFTIIGPDGLEAVGGQHLPDGSYLPFIFADPDNAIAMLPIAIDKAIMTKVPFRIIQFSCREDLTDKYISGHNEAIRAARQN